MPHSPHRAHPSVSQENDFAPLSVLVIAIAWWLLTRPYHGIWHDGLFYAGLALQQLHPEEFARDIFFMYGSQGDFTLFGILQAGLSGWVGVEGAFLLLTLAGAGFWIFALFGLLRRWLAGVELAAALILLLSLDPHYAGFDLIGFGEGFATPRIFSEAMVMLALSWWLQERRVSAYSALAGALLFHPLIALAGMGVFAWAGLRARIANAPLLWLGLLAAGLALLQLLVWVGISPRLDPYWRQLVEQRSPFVFPQLWNLSDWLRLLLDAALLWLASRRLRGEPASLASLVLPVLALGMLWALAAGIMEVQLAVAAQLQRVQWLAHLLALTLAIPLCVQLWQAPGKWDRYLSVGVASSLVFPLNLGGFVLPVLYGLHRWGSTRLPDSPPSRGLPLMLFLAIPLSGLALWGGYLVSGLGLNGLVSGRPVWVEAFIQAPIALGVFFAGYKLFGRRQPGKAWMWLYAACVLAVGTMNWDIRKPWNIVYDQPSRIAAIAPVQALIPKHALVYWESGVHVTPDNVARLDTGYERAWFWLQRAHYVSFGQAAGSIFYRQTAVEIARRAEHLRRWGFRDGNLDWHARVKPPRRFRLTLARLQGVCGDPALDFVITDSSLPEARLVFADPLTGRKFSVYDCGSLRRKGG